jgi:hypothetical protein
MTTFMPEGMNFEYCSANYRIYAHHFSSFCLKRA